MLKSTRRQQRRSGRIGARRRIGWEMKHPMPRKWRRITTRSLEMPAQCDIGFPCSKPVTWGDVLEILPCMGDDTAL
ncbi:hypothetical protein WJX84_007397, partial [Apatococcus fuscideae]